MRTLDDDEWKQVFDARGNDPRRWRGYAYNLLESSAALLALWTEWQRGFAERAAGKDQYGEPMVGYHGAASMLRGMACECLLKAFGLERGSLPKLAQDGKFVRVKGLGDQHDLVRLAEIVGFVPANDDEKRALRGLAQSIVAGRYPTMGEWEKERRLYVEGPSLLVTIGMEADNAGDSILRRLVGGPLPSERPAGGQAGASPANDPDPAHT